MPVIVGSVLAGEVVACCLFTAWNGFSFQRTVVDMRRNIALLGGTGLVLALGIWLMMSG